MLQGTASSTDSKKADLIDPIINIRQLLEIASRLDFNTVGKQDNVLDILIKLFPDRPREELLEVEKYVTTLVESNTSKIEALKAQQPKQKSQSSFFLKVTFAIASTIAGAYFGAPITAACGKTAVTQIYTILFGLPDSKSFTYGVLFVPCQKFVAFVAKEYGGYAVGLLAAPTAYNMASLFEYLSHKVTTLGRLLSRKKTSPQYSLQKVEDIIAEFEDLAIKSDAVEDLDPVEALFGDEVTTVFPNYKRTSPDKTVGGHDFNSVSTKSKPEARIINTHP
ncbi:MAG: hypothetical protein AB7I18_01875 [Candidatus Berkiella sp.]